MKKKKSRVGVIIIAVLLIAAVAGGSAYYMLVVRNASSAETTVTDTPEAAVLEAGQTIVYAKLTSVIGNNITYSVVEEQTQGGDDVSTDDATATRTFAQTTTYVETGETGELQIPVGTDVITKLGTTTTFVKLSTGNTVAMLMQGDDGVMKIWIV